MASAVTLTTSVCMWCYVYVIIIKFPFHITNPAPQVSGLASYVVHKFQLKCSYYLCYTSKHFLLWHILFL